MEHSGAGLVLRDGLLLLGFALTFVLLFRRLGLGATLGYLVAGAVVGPHVLGLIGDVRHAVFGMVAHQLDGDFVESCLGGIYLGEDIDTVLIFFDHAGDTADLAFGAFEAFEDLIFIAVITVGSCHNYLLNDCALYIS